jgi:hypothetical protein
VTDFTFETMGGEFPMTAGTTYYFYLIDTNSGTAPISHPLQFDITEIIPACTPGEDGVLGGMLTRVPTTLPTITENFVAVDDDPTGYVYIGGTGTLYRVPKSGGTAEDVFVAAGLATTDTGYVVVIAGPEIFTIDDSTTSTTNRVVRISADGGATWIAGGESYATFPRSPTDDFRGAVVVDGTMYLITHEVTTTEATEIWSLPVGATTVPVTPTFVGTIPFLDCTDLAADSTYLYTMCENGGEIVRIDRSTLATHAFRVSATMSTTRNALAVDDTTGDGIADAIYFHVATEDAFFACGLMDPVPFSTTLVNWGTGTTNYGLALDAATDTLYAFDDDTRELIVIR